MKNEIQQTLYLPTFTHWHRVGINSIQRVSIIVSIILLFSLRSGAQDFSLPEDPQIDVAELGGLLKICGIAFCVNSENVHKAVIVDVACPTENNQIIMKVTEALFGKSSDDIEKACRDFLYDVQTGKVEVNCDAPVLTIFSKCTGYQKGRIFSCVLGQQEVYKEFTDVGEIKVRGYIYDLSKGRSLF